MLSQKCGKKVLLVFTVIIAIGMLAAGALCIKSHFFPGVVAGELTYPVSSNLLLIQEVDQAYIYGSGSKPIIVDGTIAETLYTMDGKGLAISSDTDSSGSILSYCNGKDLVFVSDDVCDCIFSGSGNKIMYIKDCDYEKLSYTLYVFDVKSRESTMIANDAYEIFAISPDGGSIAYATVDSSDNYGESTLTGYVRIAGHTAESLGEDKIAFAISNKGEYIYYSEDVYGLYEYILNDEDNKLFVRHENTDREIASGIPHQPFYLNRDYSEILFFSDSAQYISIQGAEKVKIAGDIYGLEMVIPNGLQTNFSLDTVILNIQTFRDQLYYIYGCLTTQDNTLLYLKNDLSAVQKPSDYRFDNTMSSDGQDFYFINGDFELAYYKNYREWESDADIIQSEDRVFSYVLMPDQSTVYFVDDNEDLWVARGNSDAQKIDAAVDEQFITVSSDGKGIYYLADLSQNSSIAVNEGTFYYIENVSQAVPEKIAENVCTFTVSDYGTVYYVCEKTDSFQHFGTAYLSRNGSKYTKVLDEAYIWGGRETILF